MFNSKLLNTNKSKLTRGTAKNHLINKMGMILLILLVKGDELFIFFCSNKLTWVKWWDVARLILRQSYCQRWHRYSKSTLATIFNLHPALTWGQSISWWIQSLMSRLGKICKGFVDWHSSIFGTKCVNHHWQVCFRLSTSLLVQAFSV